MAKNNLNVRILQKRDTASNWTSQNPTLMKGEIAIVDTLQGETRLKIGNGSSTFTELPFIDEPLRNSLQSKSGNNVVYQTTDSQDGSDIQLSVSEGSFPEQDKTGDIIYVEVTNPLSFSSGFGMLNLGTRYVPYKGMSASGDSPAWGDHTVTVNGGVMVFMYAKDKWIWTNMNTMNDFVRGDSITSSEMIDTGAVVDQNQIASFVNQQISSFSSQISALETQVERLKTAQPMVITQRTSDLSGYVLTVMHEQGGEEDFHFNREFVPGDILFIYISNFRHSIPFNKNNPTYIRFHNYQSDHYYPIQTNFSDDGGGEEYKIGEAQHFYAFIFAKNQTTSGCWILFSASQTDNYTIDDVYDSTSGAGGKIATHATIVRQLSARMVSNVAEPGAEVFEDQAKSNDVASQDDNSIFNSTDQKPILNWEVNEDGIER